MRPPTELRARCGDWYEDPCDRDADWQSPNDDFLADLPRDPRELSIGERKRLSAPMDGMRPGTLIASTSVRYGISPAAGAPPAG
ncbi:hypothetical protein [Actinoplanes sp. ATCC 53533]|uniref:hypothetical protein n=1 Tax=Actinoplanes sp. ATCC 53533 TaxID=1288362 RepID=UPI001F365BC6|nr:hypothetical protein [Actinoplanes sp. ATCC 53533]